MRVERVALDTNVLISALLSELGDEDLLILDPFERIRIVTPADFLSLVER